MIRRLQIRHLYPVIPLAVLAVVPLAQLRDNGFLWHVRAGVMQLASGRVITLDPFSYTAGGESWRTYSWLAEILYAYLDSVFGGIEWVPVLVALVSVTTLSITGLTIYSASRSVVVASGWLIVGIWLLAPFSQPRPVVFSYLMLTALVMILTSGDKVWWAVVPLIWLWAGLHGTWVIGIGLVVLAAAQHRSSKLGIAAGVAAITSGLTAHGFGAWKVLVSFAGSTGALEHLQEWFPPDFGDIAQMPYLLIVGGIVVAATWGRISLADLWVVLPFMAFGFMTRRSVPVATLVLVPFAARAVIVHLPQSRAKWNAIPVVIATVIAALVIGAHATSHVELEPERFPSDGAIEAAGDGHFFHDDGVGGYLIYRSGPDRQVYIDDRAELYGAERFAEFAAAKEGTYEDLFERLDMRSAILKTKWPLYTILLRDGWAIEYEDENFVVLMAPNH